jgi:hypothetical protein
MARRTLGNALLSLALLAAPAAFAVEKAPATPTTKPIGGGSLELRAETAFNRGEWALALPMLKQVADQVKDNPDRLATIQEQIRVCERNIAKAQADLAAQSPTATAATAAPATQPTAEARKPIPAPKAGEVVELLIKDLGNFDYDIEHGGNIPPDIKALNGAALRTRGYMIPLDQAEAITEFALVPSLFACCFGQPPQIQHTLVVHCPKGKAVSYFPDEITVEGTLKVEEKKDDGYIVSIFEIDAKSVKPAPK